MGKKWDCILLLLPVAEGENSKMPWIISSVRRRMKRRAFRSATFWSGTSSLSLSSKQYFMNKAAFLDRDGVINRKPSPKGST